MMLSIFSILTQYAWLQCTWGFLVLSPAPLVSFAERQQNLQRNLPVSYTKYKASRLQQVEVRGENVKKWIDKNFFLLGMIGAVGFAKLAPGLGVDGSILRPEKTIGSYGVALVFLLSGLSLKLSELKAALFDIRYNSAVQFFSLFIWPLFGYISFEIIGKGLFSMRSKLLDGLLLTSCLPTSINMCVILTSSAGGSVAPALANAVIGNFLGVFLTPVLVFITLSTSVTLPIKAAICKLAIKVILPITIGQFLRSTPLLSLQSHYKSIFKRASEICLLAIVWNAFCNSFARGFGIQPIALLSLGFLLICIHLATLYFLRSLFNSPFFQDRSSDDQDDAEESSNIIQRQRAVAAAFVASHKTLAMGLPLITTLFAGSPDLAYLCAPIMLLHPTQLALGSLLLPSWRDWILGVRSKK
uniref:Sodium/bile acid cotransporter n=1 Tax=Aureoumbra lagunensis TaxID=44058 RepID=A0A7S3K623_9STRA